MKAANTADNKASPQLFAQEPSIGPSATSYWGGWAYDDTDIHEPMEAAGPHSGICLHDYRTNKQHPSKQRWSDFMATPEHQAATAMGYRAEQPCGTAKEQRCCYLGALRYGIQAFLTFVVVNCRRVIKLLIGITFREQARGHKAEPIKLLDAGVSWV